MSASPAPAYKRVLLKLSGEALMGEQSYGIDPAVATQIAKDVADIQNIWASAAGGPGIDGVQVFTIQGERIGQILLPERCANIAFGGQKRNRLFMAASQSLYSLYVNTRGSHFC